MVRIGKLELDAPFFQAGLAGYSDAAMRLVARRHGAPYCVTEAMLDQALLHGGKAVKAAQLDPADHPIAGQIIGWDPAEMAAAARLLVRLGYDVIDVNLACPVRKIRKRGRGGHLLAAPTQCIDLLKAVRQAVGADAPCTVKLRRGSDDSARALADFHAIFEAAITLGYAGATVHGRTVEQQYVGPARWDFLRDLVQTYGHVEPIARSAGRKHGGATESPRTTFAIFGSGDVWTAHDIFRMIEQTGVQAVSVARGCIGNPWLFAQARALLAGDEEAARRPPTIVQQRQVLLDHFELAIRVHGEDRASRQMRKFGIRFARHHPQAGEVARAFIAVKSLKDWHAVIDRHYGAPSEALVG